MAFVAGLLRRLHDDRQVSLAAAASEVYTATLYQYHGWITSAAFTVALKVSHLLKPVVDSKGFIYEAATRLPWVRLCQLST